MGPALPDVPPEFLEAVSALRRAHPPAASRFRLPLTAGGLGDREIAAAFEALVRGPMTQGPRVAAFESEFAREHGVSSAVFCNSGSSANLLMMSCLARPGGPGGPAVREGDEVVVPALTWPTTVWPIVQHGALPVLADVSPETLNVTTESIERALSPKTRAVIVVHTLGNPAPVDALAGVCARRGVELLEDACESLDADLGGRRVGSFGRMASFSFYVSHHITTIEGGMVLCRDAKDAERLRVMRAHGWTRQMEEDTRRAVESRYPDLDPRFLFVEVGYNLRGTDVQAAIGRTQFAYRAESLQKRRAAAAAWSAALERHDDLFAPVRFLRGASPFAFPLVVRSGAPCTRRRLMEFLEARGVETRPLVAGNLARQPVMERVSHRIAGPLTGADFLHDRGVYVGLHPGLTTAQIAYLPEVLEEFAREVRR